MLALFNDTSSPCMHDPVLDKWLVKSSSILSYSSNANEGWLCTFITWKRVHGFLWSCWLRRWELWLKTPIYFVDEVVRFWCVFLFYAGELYGLPPTIWNDLPGWSQIWVSFMWPWVAIETEFVMENICSACDANPRCWCSTCWRR